MAIKTIVAGVLNVGYTEYGPSDGWPCVFGHGFPYDVNAYTDTAHRLAESGARVIVPYLRDTDQQSSLAPQLHDLESRQH